MAYVQPVSKIIVLSGCGLSPDYQHTYRFRTDAEQYEFFYSFKYAEFDAQSYQRVSVNELKIERIATNLYSCDYLMFQNDRGTVEGLSDKWYYAFITDVEYINEHTTKIRYQIDEIQTWFTRLIAGMQPCYILRQHVSIDGLYGNTQPENFDLGSEYQYESQGWTNLAKKPTYVAPGESGVTNGAFGNWYPVVVLPYENNQISTGMLTGVPNSLEITYFSTVTGSRGFFTYLLNLKTERWTEIVDMFMYPADLLKKSPGESGNVINETVRKAGKSGGNPWKDYFTPNNNKLYTYPYCYISVTNGCGKTVNFKNEFFARDQNDAIFDITGTFGVDPEFSCIAREYNETQTHAAMNGLTISGVPKIPWVTDAYKVYMAQNSSSIRTNNILTAVQALGGIGKIIEGPAATMATLGANDAIDEKSHVSASGINDSAAFSGIAAMYMNNAKYADARKMTDNTHTATAPNAMYLEGLFGFQAFMARIPVEYAKRIDKFWDVYGYAINTTDKPNIFSRKSWNYLQAINITITTRVPAHTKSLFARILANGITFWDKSVTIGNYNADNTL